MTLVVNFAKAADGLVPAVVQDSSSGTVLMLGYMSPEALRVTQASGRVTFFSRSRQRLWTKGESSGAHLAVVDIAVDCDGDALLVRAKPEGPTCHTGATSCFAPPASDAPAPEVAILATLDATIAARIVHPSPDSYTSQLVAAGTSRCAQKVGEEGVEVAIAGVAGSDTELSAEAADLIYHLLVLLRARGLSLSAVLAVLRDRHSRETA